MQKKLIANKLGALTTLLDDRGRQASGEVSDSGAAALLTLAQRGPHTTTQLAAAIGLSQPACQRLVDKLVTAGLVARRSRTGRAVPLKITKAGKRTAADLQERRLTTLRDAVNVLNKTEKQQLDTLLDAMLARLAQDGDIACRFCDRERCHGSACPVERGDQRAAAE
ncbi:DNA-binding transcriptional regulator, MarR family [Limimonas halophila]|uniref:DNA-binding transcriptional regulator, MarR family n=1 Tax=Limimonas halophila TaxID=1082479 RepID=A0A1G7U051_9PROT|nr:MarR family transcriptional regulator [Limimonas halophila]SDG40916.1 DNA-binding transcriptional regulator, MarR family [Limimonas halophila]